MIHERFQRISSFYLSTNTTGEADSKNASKNPLPDSMNHSLLYTLHRYFLLSQLSSTQFPRKWKHNFSINASVVVIKASKKPDDTGLFPVSSENNHFPENGS